MEREEFMEFGYGEEEEWLELDLEVKDEVVSDWTYFTGQQDNYCNFQNIKVMKMPNIKFFLKDISFSCKYHNSLIENFEQYSDTFDDPKKCKKFFPNLYWLHRHIYWVHMKPLNCPFFRHFCNSCMGCLRTKPCGSCLFCKNNNTKSCEKLKIY